MSDKKSFLNKKTIFDLILIAALLIAAASAFLVINSMKEPGRTVVVKLRDEVIEHIPLEDDGEYVLNGGTNVLVIENGEVYMKSASCPGYPPSQRCTNQGRISKTLEKITCAPNMITVIIE